ncbi:hypothetical protein E2C01_034846 [Portunus trituberculatus]|uniref:Uncharacterized protein n=1 Tax=Portunus trituberculatus TaxID=210409 RepID=A0A5B7F817_PORTR|nr:hypothetical protein [Portunus trituberculatus]
MDEAPAGRHWFRESRPLGLKEFKGSSAVYKKEGILFLTTDLIQPSQHRIHLYRRG